jgi:hypothetical protein
MGQSVLLLGTCWGTHRKLDEHIENMMRTK